MTGSPVPTDRRTFAVAVGTGVACSALAAVAAAKPWVDVHGAVRSVGAVAVGSTLAPYAESAPALALALVVLASWGVLLVLRGRARTLMAAVGLLFAVGLLVVVAVGFTEVPGAVRHAMTDQLGTSPGVTARVQLPHTGWYWLALVCSIGAVPALVAAVRRAHRWPAMGSRYDAPRPPVAGGQDMWRTLDEGHDPTDPGSA